MKRMRFMLLTFICFSIITMPPAVARDVGKHETVASGKVVNAMAGFDLVCYNAALAVVDETGMLTSQDAATHDVAILTKTPAVEVTSVAIVAGSGLSYQRLCGKAPVVFNYKNNKMADTRITHLHIDPGLIG